MKYLSVVLVAALFSVQLTASEESKKRHESLPELNATWVLQELKSEDLKKGRIVQGCCGNKSTGVCAAPVLKRDCTSSGYVWKKGKSCYEKDKTGCMD